MQGNFDVIDTSFTAIGASTGTLGTDKVSRSGDTMTGKLTGVTELGVNKITGNSSGSINISSAVTLTASSFSLTGSGGNILTGASVTASGFFGGSGSFTKPVNIVSSLTVRNATASDSYSLAVTTAADGSTYHLRITTAGIVEHTYGIVSLGGNSRGINATDLQSSRASGADVASGLASTVGGGHSNRADAPYSTVSGGYISAATAQGASVGGGTSNACSGVDCHIGGGENNTSTGQNGTVGGGVSNSAGAGRGTTISGGGNNATSGQYSTISGGQFNLSGGQFSCVAGGSSNSASATASSSLCGDTNLASGAYSTTIGGRNLISSGQYSVTAGHKATASAESAFMFAGAPDSDATVYTNSLANSFRGYFPDGYRLDGQGVQVSSLSATARIQASGGINASSSTFGTGATISTFSATGALTLASALGVPSGGMGAGTFTDGGILFGNGTSAIGATGVLTNGQLLIGDGTEEPTAATLTATDNETTITNGAGSITVGIPDSIVIKDTATVQGNAFSVGGTTLTVSNGVVSMGGANALTSGTGVKLAIGMLNGQELEVYSTASGSTTVLATSLGGATYRPLNIDSSATEINKTSGGNVTIGSGGTPLSVISTGTYTPTLTNVANIAASTAYTTNYRRIGNIVDVWGLVAIDPTTTLTDTTLRMSLPIATNCQDDLEIGGSAANSLNEASRIYCPSSQDAAHFDFKPVDVSNNTWSFHFNYVIK